jgi:catecholate siderophore receptor
VLASGDKQEVQGIEVGVEGAITDQWSLQASYTWLDTETTEASNLAAAAVGKPIPFAAENAATFWTTYMPVPALTLGLGARYNDAVWLNNTNTQEAPHYFSVDAMVSYAFGQDFTVQFNATNLTDREDNFDQVTGSRTVRAPGRAYQVSLSKAF